jgi:hypothetical protein
MDRCIALHSSKPWVPNFDRVLIQPLRQVNPEWLGAPVTLQGSTWYEPTRAFWETHCQAAHQGGRGCSAQVHTAFLTSTGANAEFQYANVLKDGSFYIQDAQGFERECEWWRNQYEQVQQQNAWAPAIALILLIGLGWWLMTKR